MILGLFLGGLEEGVVEEEVGCVLFGFLFGVVEGIGFVVGGVLFFDDGFFFEVGWVVGESVFFDGVLLFVGDVVWFFCVEFVVGVVWVFFVEFGVGVLVGLIVVKVLFEI